ncbi:MAG: hypothetical protein P4L85_15565 [Paludisphaera borealis]|uniref:hypothetical protein n=1 Tax=Paludisphaera borealis TaxID=1387353 RepID=UPI0028404621|nr:hypothetical protein [Paludisphaera borealis]MDR3620769.1 hypothetical protein [Paludisphaera borealis]
MLAIRYPLWKLTALIGLVAVGLACVRYNTFWSRLILIELLMLGFFVPVGSLVRNARAQATSRAARGLIPLAYLAVLFAFGWGIVLLLSILQHPRI